MTSQTATSQNQASRYDKKYFILTFEAEFEKVHYPMPLAYLEEPDMQSMLNTFQRLQSHVPMNTTSRSVLQHNHSEMLPSDLLAEKMQSEFNGMHRYNTMQDFFAIEMEND